MNRRLGVLSGLLVLLLAVFNVNADIIEWTGDIQPVAPPPSVSTGDFERTMLIRAFGERHDLRLQSPLPVDITAVGLVDSDDDLSPGAIPSGTYVNSVMLHFDPVRTTDTILRGTITFENEILGIIAATETLDETDSIVGLSSTRYPTNNSRGMGFSSTQDMVELRSDRRTIEVQMVGGSLEDQIRVITRGNADGTSKRDDDFPIGVDGDEDPDGLLDDQDGDDDEPRPPTNGDDDDDDGGLQPGSGDNCDGLSNDRLDIIPGNRDNKIHLERTGTFAIAILSDRTFNALDCIDFDSLTFGPTGDEETVVACGAWDIGMDGFIDVQCDIDASDADFDVDDDEGFLLGELVTGEFFEMSDSIKVLGPNDNRIGICSLSTVQTRQIGHSMLFAMRGQNIEDSRVWVFSTSGALVFDSGFESGTVLRWNMRRPDGAMLPNGVYFYQALVQGPNGELVRSEIRKFMILR